MRTIFVHEGDGLYYSDTEIVSTEVDQLGGVDGLNAITNEAVLVGEKECRRTGECALKAYVQCRDEAGTGTNHDMFIEFSCGEKTDLCPKPNTGPVDAAFESLEEQAKGFGVLSTSNGDW